MRDGMKMTETKASERTNSPAGLADEPRSKRRNRVERQPDLPTTARGRETRSRLKEAARTVLERIGYRHMRLADVAAEADVPTSLLYHYFTGTAQITAEVLSDLLSELEPKVQERSGQRDAFGAILAANEIMVEAYARSPGLMRCLLHFDEDEAGFSAIYRSRTHNWNLRIARNIASRFPNEAISYPHALIIAYALGGMFDSFLFELYVDRNPELSRQFATVQDVALFLAILWYRCLYLANPPSDQMRGFDFMHAMHAASANLGQFGTGLADQ
jgi:AcrR family transcriptional regulator